MARSTFKSLVQAPGTTGLVFFALLVAIGAGALRSEAQAPSESAPVRAIGTLQAMADGPDGMAIELPDVTVSLEDSNRRSAAVAATDLDGSFELSAAPGTYRLCYAVGRVRGCGPSVELVDSTALVGDVTIDARPSIYGTVLTGDGRPCWISDAFFGLNESTRVGVYLSEADAVPRAETRANVQGEYALFELVPRGYRIAATCERANVAAAADPSAGPQLLNLVLPSRAPVVPDAAALARNRSAFRAAPGVTLELRAPARDPDGDRVRYIWRALDGSGRIRGGATPNAFFQLPAAEGLRSVYLMAADGRGGFTYRRVDVEGARSDRIGASGRAVDDASGTPVRNATVTFGSARARTDANGWFTVESAARRDGRYVLNIRHPDYALLSQVVDREARGASYAMIPVQAARMNAGAAIRLLDRTSGGMCANPAARGGRACATRGARVALPAGALVDAGGAPAEGPVRAAVATIDPSQRMLPGEPGVAGPGERALLSIGAVEVRFSDARGRPLNLRPGTTAEVRMPIGPAGAASAPPTARMWTYDEENGRWIAGGRARLVRTVEGAFYVGRTRHFSTINMAIEANPSNATCVRVELDSGFSSWTELRLRAYVSFGTSVAAQSVDLDTDQYHGIFALPYLSGSTIRLQLSGKLNGIPLNVMSDIVPIGPPPPLPGRPKMTGDVLIPPYPYSECGVPIRMSPQGAVPPFVIDAAGRAIFLGPNRRFNPPTPQGAAYYAAIDPQRTRTTLGGWWRANGFDPNGEGGTNTTFTRASYMNYNDLGFGRDMHCLIPQAGRLACYVTNYGAADQNPQNANDAADRNPRTQGATVAMEYDSSAGDNAVQFYVFNGGAGDAPRIEFADLDGLGPRPVPHLCMVCHGGNFENNRVKFARFREFDLPSFRYRDGAAWDHGQAAPAGLNAAAFARLNQMVRDIHPGTPIAALINAWYPTFGGAPLPGRPTPPAGWPSETAAAYHGIYGQTCRTCHIARDEGEGIPYPRLVFDTADYFRGTAGAVCGRGTPKLRVMPNALITYRNLWLERPQTRIQQFEALTRATNCGGP